jgi:hypothetical protein
MKYEIANLLVVVIISSTISRRTPLRRTRRKSPRVAVRFLFVHSDCQLNYHDILALNPFASVNFGGGTWWSGTWSGGGRGVCGGVRSANQLKDTR